MSSIESTVEPSQLYVRPSPKLPTHWPLGQHAQPSRHGKNPGLGMISNGSQHSFSHSALKKSG